MLELADLSKRLARETFKEVWPKLVIEMGECQREARAAGAPVVILFEGWDAAGKGTLINALSQALDPRGFKVWPVSAPTEEARLRPWMWRFWNMLPAAGAFAIFDRSWYGRLMVERLERQVGKKVWQQAFQDILEFERQLADSGMVIVKLWLHISRKEQARRFKRLEADPVTAWKVGKAEWRQSQQYDKWLKAAEEMIERTGTACAPWTVVEATQDRFARVKVFETVIQAVKRGVDAAKARKAEAKPSAAPQMSRVAAPTILDRVDLTQSLERADYEKKLKKLQERLFRLEHELFLARVPAVIAYEGWDAAGKGGNIRRLTQGLDPRGYEVVPIAVPSAEEKAHHYLWRFWRAIPKAGHITVFDRTWYGRVLVERVEGFCSEAEWRRAYREINEFERQLTGYGTVLVKFWLQIDKEEQLRRFNLRQQTGYKQWKITDEDWRNREKWDRYEAAVIDMLEQTSTSYAPWTILEANCKLHARVKSLATVADALEAGLARRRG
ncbi:MAG TPA: phosphate--AMP phosphotransferase [Candidatus Brocadiia bacterium]|nr:phosphate--AMP phosphotransferase [Candidatus Brocadiia bacterium]